MQPIHRLLAVAALPLLCAGHAAAASSSPEAAATKGRTLLVRVQHHAGIPGQDDFRAEILVYRDGLVVSFGGEVGSPAHYNRAIGSRAAMTQLEAVLAASRVSQLEAHGCRSNYPPSPPEGFHDVALTWYGKGRQNRLTFGTSGSEPCDPAVGDAALAIASFLGGVTYVDQVETAP